MPAVSFVMNAVVSKSGVYDTPQSRKTLPYRNSDVALERVGDNLVNKLSRESESS